MIEQMKGLSPLDKLNQGYSYAADEKGNTLSTIDQVAVGEMVMLFVKDGKLETRILSKEEVKWEDRANEDRTERE